MEHIRIMTLNAWSGLTYEGILRMVSFETTEARRTRFLSLVSAINEASPHVLGISEANPLPGYARELARLTSMDQVHHMGVSGVRLGRVGIPWNLLEGDMLLARKDLRLHLLGRAWLGGSGWVRNAWSLHTGDVTQAILGSITAGAGKLCIAQVHLRHAPPLADETLALLDSLAVEFGYSLREYRRAVASLRKDAQRKDDEVIRLRDFLAGTVPEGVPHLVMGDFNAEPSWPCMAPLMDKGYRLISPMDGTPTWDGDTNPIIMKYYFPLASARKGSLYQHLLSVFDIKKRVIDFILAPPSVSPDMVASSGLCLISKKGAPLSDHYGVMAVLKSITH